MEVQKSHSEKEKQSKKKSLWSLQELKKLLEFFILNPHKVCLSAAGQQSINSLANCVSPGKNYLQCQQKMEHLMSKHKSYEKVVDYLTKQTKANEQWIKEKKNSVGYFKIQKFKNQFKNIEQDYSFEEHARRLFISDFNYYEVAMTDKRQNTTNQVFIHQESVQQTKIQQIGLQTQKLEQKPDGHIIQLRFVVFMVKYKRQLAKQIKTKMTNSIFQKMSDFIEAKSDAIWRQNHERLMKKMKNIQNIIENSMQNLYVKRQELDKEIVRIEAFYQEDLRKEMNAFMRKSQLKLISSQEEIDLVVQKIKCEITKRIDGPSTKKQDPKNDQSKDSSGKKLLYNQIAIKIPIILNLTSQKIQLEANIQSTMKQSFKFYQKASQSPKQQKSQLNLSKTKQLQSKKNIKKSFLMKIPKQNPDIFMDSDQDDQGEQSSIENDFNPNRISNQQCNRDQTPNKVNKQTFEKTKNKELILGESKSYSSENNRSKHHFQQSKPQLKVRTKNPLLGKLTWTISQRMKVNAFLNLNSEKSCSKNYLKNYQLAKKLIKYIGTQKTQQNWRHYKDKGSSSNGFDLEKLINSSKLSLNITNEFMWRCKQLGDRYLETRRLSIGSDELIIKIHTLLQPIPIKKNFQEQIERRIKRGPFLQIVLECSPQKKQTEKLTDEKSSQYQSVNLIEIQENLEFSINLTNQFGNPVPQKIETYFTLLIVEQKNVNEQFAKTLTQMTNKG